MMVRNISKATACFQRDHHEKGMLAEQSPEFLEADCKMELFDSVEMCLSIYDKENARKRIQKALHKVKEERTQIEEDLRINFELAKARVTESNFVYSTKANRIGRSSEFIFHPLLLCVFQLSVVTSHDSILSLPYLPNSGSNGHGSCYEKR